MAGNNNSSSGTNRMAVPEAKDAMKRFKEEVASELGVPLKDGYIGNNADKKAQRNISGCKRLGIPFGIYWYSYADTPALAKEEGTDVVAKLKQFGVNPSDLAYPVYYDLEKWTWEGH